MTDLTSHYSGAIDFQITETSESHATAELEITPRMLNPFGTVHAGAMIWFADVTATTCAIGTSKIGPKGEGFPLAVDLHTILLANRRSGVLTARAELIRRGRTLVYVRTCVSDAQAATLIEMTTTHLYAN